MGEMNAVEITNLTKTFGDVTALDNVTFEVKTGELFGLLGPNGSGKTTMIKLLTGQLPPTNGTMTVLDRNVQENPILIREQVGIIPEQETPPSFLTAEEYLHFVCNIRQLDDIDHRCDTWFHLLNFDDQKQTLCKDLSRGTRQKLMVAQAFLHEPRLAFIDEPLINLDPIIQRIFKDFLMDYVKKGNTIFFSTHVLEIAEEICTEIAILDKGRLLHKGPITELKDTKRHLEEFFITLVTE
jgi:ABC-2 type transport system ATP-binding protein